MANFKGHALPGSFFILYGLWWSVKCPLNYISRTVNKNTQWKLKHLEIIEGAAKAGFSLVGILAEQFVPSGPHLKLYHGQPPSWVKLMNWQHSTMYLFFCISGVVDIVTHSLTKMPIGLDRFMLSISFFVEGFLFYFHVSHRPMLDQHIHSMLLTAIFASAATSLIQAFMRDNMILDLFASTLAVLQGTWFWQIGFVLYPPWGEPKWDENNHENIMFITMCFCWHYAIAILIIAANYSLVYCFKKTEKNPEDTAIEIQQHNHNDTVPTPILLFDESDEE